MGTPNLTRHWIVIPRAMGIGALWGGVLGLIPGLGLAVVFPPALVIAPLVGSSVGMATALVAGFALFVMEPTIRRNDGTEWLVAFLGVWVPALTWLALWTTGVSNRAPGDPLGVFATGALVTLVLACVAGALASKVIHEDAPIFWRSHTRRALSPAEAKAAARWTRCTLNDDPAHRT